MKINRTSISAVILTLAVVILICNHGCDKRKIADPTPGMNTAKEYWIRVKLFDNIRKCTIEGQSGIAICDQDSELTFELTENTKLDVEIIDGKVCIAGNPVCQDILITPKESEILSIGGKLYRGVFRLLQSNDPNSFDVINAVPVEAYLNGVVGAEMPSYWEFEALKAQAIACRTYSLYHKQMFGKNRPWDVTKTQSTQVYRGVEAETASVRKAISETNGNVLVCEYSDEQDRLFPAYYSSSCGGFTENSKNVFGRNVFEPLSGVECKYCRKIARRKVFNWEPVEMSKIEVNERLLKKYPNLADLEGIVSVEVKSKGNLDRITSVNLIGRNGTSDHIRGEDLRISLDPTGTRIRSTLFKMEDTGESLRFYDGRGYGHGVGLCQCGSEGMARKGHDFNEILSHYYPGSKIHRLEYADNNE
jgi:stage II sporulation protein D